MSIVSRKLIMSAYDYSSSNTLNAAVRLVYNDVCISFIGEACTFSITYYQNTVSYVLNLICEQYGKSSDITNACNMHGRTDSNLNAMCILQWNHVFPSVLLKRNTCYVYLLLMQYQIEIFFYVRVHQTLMQLYKLQYDR